MTTRPDPKLSGTTAYRDVIPVVVLAGPPVPRLAHVVFVDNSLPWVGRESTRAGRTRPEKSSWVLVMIPQATRLLSASHKVVRRSIEIGHQVSRLGVTGIRNLTTPQRTSRRRGGAIRSPKDSSAARA